MKESEKPDSALVLPISSSTPTDRGAGRSTLSPRTARVVYLLVALVLILEPIYIYHSYPESPIRALVDSVTRPCHRRFHDGRRHPARFDAVEGALRSKCPVQVEPRNVGTDWDPKAEEGYLDLATERLRGAVRIRTESFDDMKGTPDDEPRFDPFANLHTYLEATFPKVYEHLDVEKVNTYGLLLTWKGQDDRLKPIVLMAHQDTVPVPDFTVPSWTYPPFSAHLDDDGWIWGRGSTDCKNTLIGIFAALDRLVEEGYTPQRTVILSSGFDEEIGGSRSAKPLADRIEARYGRDGVALVLDEGFTGVDEAFSTRFARFATAEKGAVNVRVEVFAPGGHSSVPLGAHTGIGVLARFLVALEDHRAAPSLEAGNPMVSYLDCAADFGKVDKKLRKQIKDPRKWSKLGKELAESSPILRSFLSTSQAIDLIQGGVKVNALPEYASATINYRIDFLSSVNETLSRIAHVLHPVAKNLNVTFSAFDSSSSPDSLEPSTMMKGQDSVSVKLSVVEGSEIEPAPLTPTVGPAWELMAGTARHVFKGAVVAPSGMIANTDTKWSWNLTKNIYRFVPASMDLLKNFHTIDERIHVDAHLTGIQFFYKLIRNSEGWSTD
ncbi:hypothetical protein JCM10212_003824 [Sporobolomyces blumeae]